MPIATQPKTPSEAAVQSGVEVRVGTPRPAHGRTKHGARASPIHETVDGHAIGGPRKVLAPAIADTNGATAELSHTFRDSTSTSPKLHEAHAPIEPRQTRGVASEQQPSIQETPSHDRVRPNARVRLSAVNSVPSSNVPHGLSTSRTSDSAPARARQERLQR